MCIQAGNISRVQLTQVESFYSTYVYKYVYHFTNMQTMHLDDIISKCSDQQEYLINDECDDDQLEEETKYVTACV